jgi:4'-phosphopantetheinyl transferase
MAIYPKRELETRGAVALLGKIMGSSEILITYDEHGKPLLVNRTEAISISHSHDKLAAVVNHSGVAGVDIELIRDKVLKIKHKFLNESEKNHAGNDVEKLITYWSAKEAMYKANGKKGIDFCRDMEVTFVGDRMIGSIVTGGHKKEYTMCSEKIDDYILVYITDGR